MRTCSRRVLPYAESFIAIPQDFLVRAGIHSINAFGALFLVVVCGNVALLMFARAATREREILVRRALGAARSRIVMQLFTEALVLAAIAAVLGLTATDFALKWTLAAMSTEAEGWPFWLEGGLSATTLTYSAWLTVLAAVVAGVVPALKITRQTWRPVSVRRALEQAASEWVGLDWRDRGPNRRTVLFTAVAYVVQRQAAGIASAKRPSRPKSALRCDSRWTVTTDGGEGKSRRVLSAALRSDRSRAGATSCRGSQSRRRDPGRAAPVDAVGRRRDRTRRRGTERVGDR